ncbi:unnamed protein product, partial [Vitis vinifera]
MDDTRALSTVSLPGGEEPLYKQVLYSDYVKHFFRKAHDGKNSVEFAKI